MTDIRISLAVCFIGYITLSVAYFLPTPSFQSPFLPNRIHPYPYLHAGGYGRRPVFSRFFPFLHFLHGHQAQSHTMSNVHPHLKPHGNCASEQFSGRQAVSHTKVARISSYDHKDLLTQPPVQMSDFKKFHPTVKSKPTNFVSDVAKLPTIPLEDKFKNARNAQYSENIVKVNPTKNSNTSQKLGVTPTLRLESTKSLNETSDDPENPDLNYFDFITNKDFIIKLIENKLIKLQNQEKFVGGISVNTQLYDQIKKIEDAMGISVSLGNWTTTVPPVPVPANTTGNNSISGNDIKYKGLMGLKRHFHALISLFVHCRIYVFTRDEHSVISSVIK